MYSLTVGQQYNAQISSVHFSYWSPAADTTISLNDLSGGVLYDALNPLKANVSAIRALNAWLGSIA